MTILVTRGWKFSSCYMKEFKERKSEWRVAGRKGVLCNLLSCGVLVMILLS